MLLLVVIVMKILHPTFCVPPVWHDPPPPLPVQNHLFRRQRSGIQLQSNCSEKKAKSKNSQVRSAGNKTGCETQSIRTGSCIKWLPMHWTSWSHLMSNAGYSTLILPAWIPTLITGWSLLCKVVVRPMMGDAFYTVHINSASLKYF